MSRPGVTYQDVANAAIQVQGKNESPTVDRVREVLGTGSKSTIARHLKDWKSKMESTISSDSVPSELMSIVEDLWERVQANATIQIEQSQEQAKHFIQEIQQSLYHEQLQHQTLRNQAEQLEKQLHQEKEVSNHLYRTLEEEKHITTTLIERNDRLSQQLSEQKVETERLHQLLSHLQHNLEYYQRLIQTSQEEPEKQKALYQQELQNLRQEMASIAEQKNQLQTDWEKLQAQLKIEQADKERTTFDKNQLTQQLHEKQVCESTLKYQYKQLAQSQIQQKETIHSLEKELAIYSSQLEQANKTLEISQEIIRQLRDEKLYLIQEKAQLEGQLRRSEKVQLLCD